MKEIHNYMSHITFKVLTVLCLSIVCLSLAAQRIEAGKLSPMLRRLAVTQRETAKTRSAASQDVRQVVALVKSQSREALMEEGCRVLRAWDDIYAASIPLNRLHALTRRPEIKRIEAGRSCQLCNDTTATLLGVRDLWAGGFGRPEIPGLTGKGVVMGIQDIGFDLTHPTFYSRDLKDYRIKAFWDMLDPDTVGSSLYVGRDYVGKDELLAKAYATDGLHQTHGVHTAGIAAGSGYDSPYTGMAPEADLCLVANAVSGDAEYISEEDEYKYTTATDMLGFQYIFDYAERVGKPCVISFSEGSHEDLYGDAQLLFEVIEKMTGPGRVIVASAGNSSANDTYLLKPYGMDSISSFLYANGEAAYYTLRHSDKTTMTLHFSPSSNPLQNLESHSVTTDYIVSLEDSLLVDTLTVGNEQYLLLMASYPSCYNADEWATELYIRSLTEKTFGLGRQRIRLQLEGKEKEVECFASGGLFQKISSLPQYHTAVPTHNINFPAVSSDIIAVGGTAYRTGAYNYKGQWKDYDMGDDGRRWAYSSVGPTMQGLVKPDVVAPACNIISGYSSYYIENHPEAADVSWDVKHFTFQGREYAWNCNSGTSMSSPIVGGIVALWLQLCPTLSPRDVMQVIQATSRRYDASLTYPNNEYGWGEIDALEGAKYISEHFECINSVALESIRQGIVEHETYDLSGRKVNRKSPRGIQLIRAEGDYRKVVK